MGRFAVILAIMLAPALAWGQHRVKVETKDVQKYSLPASLDSTYMIYTFVEYKALRLDLSRLEALSKKLGLLTKKIGLQETAIKLVNKRAATLQTDLKACVASRKRVTDKWKKCDLSNRLCQAGNWKPWLITAVAAAVAVVGISLGGYYGWKYSKVK